MKCQTNIIARAKPDGHMNHLQPTDFSTVHSLSFILDPQFLIKHFRRSVIDNVKKVGAGKSDAQHKNNQNESNCSEVTG